MHTQCGAQSNKIICGPCHQDIYGKEYKCNQDNEKMGNTKRDSDIA